MAKKLTKDEAKRQLWLMGNLSWKLRGKQSDIYQDLNDVSKDVSCILVSRRFGKSFTNCVVAVETCIKTPNAVVKYACPQQRMVKTIIKPIMRIIFEDAPEEFNLKDMWKEQDKVYRFPNGSEIQIAGTDSGNAENLRGGYAQLCICDEAGFMDDLDYVVNNILLPTTDTTDGRLVLTSTPNYKDPNHEFHEMFVHPFKAQGNLIKYTIYDSPMVDEEKIQKIIERYPGKEKDPKFLCEYMCEIPKSTENSIFPEFSELKDKIIITDEDVEIPPFRDFYTAMDVGFRDLTVVLFGYYDFKEACLYILDELVLNGPEMTTQRLAKDIQFKESTVFYDEHVGEHVEPYIRVSDNDLKLINDLYMLHQIHFIATEKKNKEAYVNNARIWLSNGRVKIHEKCKHLIYHIEFGQWDKNRSKFKHLVDSNDKKIRGGHVDAVDSFVYMIRNVNESNNPFPHDFGEISGPNVFRRKKKSTELVEMMNSIFNRKTK